MDTSESFFEYYKWEIVVGVLSSIAIPAGGYIVYKLITEIILPCIRGEDDVHQFQQARQELMIRLERYNRNSQTSEV